MEVDSSMSVIGFDDIEVKKEKRVKTEVNEK